MRAHVRRRLQTRVADLSAAERIAPEGAKDAELGERIPVLAAFEESGTVGAFEIR